MLTEVIEKVLSCSVLYCCDKYSKLTSNGQFGFQHHSSIGDYLAFAHSYFSMPSKVIEKIFSCSVLCYYETYFKIDGNSAFGTRAPLGIFLTDKFLNSIPPR